MINLLDELKAKLGLSYLFVAHDLAVIRHIADRVAVMYLGKIVEIGEVDRVYDHPTHPYTQALLSAIPVPDPNKERSRQRILLAGDLPSPANPPSGLPFPHPVPEVRRAASGPAPGVHRRRPRPVPDGAAGPHVRLPLQRGGAGDVRVPGRWPKQNPTSATPGGRSATATQTARTADGCA